MALTVKYGDISSMGFAQTMQKICSTPNSLYASLRIKKMVEEIDKVREKIQHEYKEEIMKEFAKRDEKGMWDSNNFIPDPDKMEDFRKAEEAFLQKETTIHRNGLTVSDLKDIVKITPNDLRCIGFMLDITDAEEQEMQQLLKVVKG
jgi:hypothetical protein